jgi:hypothetical protein
VAAGTPVVVVAFWDHPGSAGARCRSFLLDSPATTRVAAHAAPARLRFRKAVPLSELASPAPSLTIRKVHP